ncbi:MAG: hypothetical protein FWG61_09860 [Firmicutes bacterium]|nr:hypothetical protein [Bacillota bacterium]
MGLNNYSDIYIKSIVINIALDINIQKYRHNQNIGIRPIETKYDEIKNKLAVENFSGRTVNGIMQDFFITMYMSNVVAVACREAQADVDGTRELKDNKYSYHVNVNHAIGTLKDRFILAILEPNPHIQRRKVMRILSLLAEHAVPTRPDRSKPRNHSPRRAKFRHNRKLNC